MSDGAADRPGRWSSRDVRVLVEARARQGAARVRAAFVPILLAAAAGGVAFWVAYSVLGHPFPFFAPVSAWIALGYSNDRSLRRVAELSVGVAIGVGLGDLVVHVIGSGAWQVAVVLVVATLIARFIDRGPMLTTQAGVQALVIVGLPASVATGGPLGRWTDALVGGAVAFLVAVLTPSDVRRRSRAAARTAIEELGGMLAVLARGLRTRDVADVEDALLRGRASQPALDEWRAAADSARDLVHVSPSVRPHRDELRHLGEQAVQLDRAMRNARVLARRSMAATESGDHDLSAIAAQVAACGRAVEDLADAVGAGRDPERARTALLAVAAQADPYRLAPADWHAQSLVLLLRSLSVDLLEASGTDPRAAREALPEL